MRFWIGACVCLALWSMCAGCAINGADLLGKDRRRYFENPSGTGRSVMIDVWGVNLSTIQGDLGVTIGRTRRTYFLAGPASTQSSSDQQLSDSDDTMRLKPTGAFNWRSIKPLAVRGQSEGVSLEMGMAGAGLTLGIRTFEGLCLPRDSNLLLLIKTRASHPGDDVFHVKEIER